MIKAMSTLALEGLVRRREPEAGTTILQWKFQGTRVLIWGGVMEGKYAKPDSLESLSSCIIG